MLKPGLGKVGRDWLGWMWVDWGCNSGCAREDVYLPKGTLGFSGNSNEEARDETRRVVVDRVDAKLLWVSTRPGLVWSGRRLGLFLLVAAAFLFPRSCWLLDRLAAAGRYARREGIRGGFGWQW